MKNFIGLLFLLLMVVGCAPNQVEPSVTPSSLPSTLTLVPTSAATPTLTVTPSPTLVLPVAYQTPIPSSDTHITSENVKNLREVARYYGEMYFTAALSGDHKLLFVRDPVGIDIYDYLTNEHINHVDLLGGSRGSDLQVSKDGEWALVDQYRLIHFSSDKEYEIKDLNFVFPMKEGNKFREIHLSPDGHKLMIVEFRCNYDGCVDDNLELITLPDMQILYSWNNGGYLEIHGWDAVFSPDGSLIAARIENQMIIWRTSDQVQVAVIQNIQGNAPAIFSSDSSLIAIGQLDTVQIWDVLNGEKIQTIKGLCGELYDPPQPIFLDAKNVVALECPRSGKGIVNGWSVTDATAILKRIFGNTTISRIVFEGDKDQVTLLENPRKVGPWITPNTPYTIQFLDNGDLTFVQRDDQLRNMACIIKPNGQANCSEDTILGTDEQFYTYAWKDDCIEFYRGFTVSGSPVYSVCWKGYFVNALDPINSLLFYTAPSSGGNANLSNSVVIGLENNRSRIAESKGSEIEKVAFSGDKTLAAVCRRLGGVLHFDVVDKDKLVLIDLSQKTVIYQQSFTCLNMPMMVLTKDGSKLIAAYGYIGKYGYTWHKLLIMNTTPPFQKKIFDIGCDNFNALTLSPDESFLVVACNDGTLRLLNPDTAAEIYRQPNIDPDLWGLAFSKDGTMLAMASRRGFISVWAVQTAKQ